MNKLTHKNERFIKVTLLIPIYLLSVNMFFSIYTLRAKALARNIPSTTQYVIISSYFLHKTFIYDKNNNYKLIKSIDSCGNKATHRGIYRLTDLRINHLNGSIKDSNNKSIYHEYNITCYNKSGKGDGTALHSVLYKGYYNQYKYPLLYHNTKEKIQNSVFPTIHHWTNGCTRMPEEDAKWIYKNCKAETGYGIIR